MPARIFHVLDTVIACSTVLVSASASALLHAAVTTGTESQMQELYLLLLPLIGALILSGGAIMLNPAPEKRRTVIGRAAVALFFGSVVPSVLALFHPAIKEIMLHPVVLLFMGGCVGMLVYIVSRPLFERLFARADVIADDIEKRIEERIDKVGKS